MVIARSDDESIDSLPVMGSAQPELLPSQKPDDLERPRFKYRLVNYKGTNMFADWIGIMPEVEEFASKPSDIFLASFPKSGTTWVETIITLILNHGDPTSIPETHGFAGLNTWRFPHLEARWTNMRRFDGQSGVRNVEFLHRATTMEDPRRIKTHLPYNLLPKDIPNSDNPPHIIYVYRNVKDIMVSLYYHYLCAPCKIHEMKDITFPKFVQQFMDDQVESAPYFRHISSYWENRHKSNMFLISYEELIEDHAGSIRKIANFLSVQLTDNEVEQVRANSTADSMREGKIGDGPNARLGHRFIRSGKIGSWKTHFTPELSEQTDLWIKKNVDELELDVRLMAAASGQDLYDLYSSSYS